MTKQEKAIAEAIADLVKAHRASEDQFDAAQAGCDDRSREFARIIGRLQGVIAGVAIDLGFCGNIREKSNA